MLMAQATNYETLCNEVVAVVRMNVEAISVMNNTLHSLHHRILEFERSRYQENETPPQSPTRTISRLEPPPLRRFPSKVVEDVDISILEDNYDEEDVEVVGYRRYTDREGLWLVVKNGNDFEKKSLKSFIDQEYFTSQAVCDVVNKLNSNAKKTPYFKRQCLLCNSFAKQGKTICEACTTKGFENIIYG